MGPMPELTFTDQNFAAEVLQSDVPVLVDFWAPWCGPCRIQSPIIEDVAEAAGAKAKVGKLNVDENPKMAAQFAVMSIPALKVFKKGEVVAEFVGVQDKDTLLGALK